jgi:predicted permease
MWSDLRYALRALLSGRLFTIVAVACLAAGVATNTAMFSVFDAIFWRPLPFPDSDRLVTIRGRNPETRRSAALTLADARDLATTVQSLSTLAAYSRRTSTLTDTGEPERIASQLVTSNLFATLGVQPQRGQAFGSSDDLLTAAPNAVISDNLWHSRYRSDPAAIGRLIRLDNVPYTIVGIMPPGFGFPDRTDVWIAIAPALGAAGAASRGVTLLGRLLPEAVLSRANAELASRVLPPAGTRAARSGVALPLRAANVGGEERTITGALMGATSVLLLIACANVANLLLARGAGRRREIAVRAALGAGRARIFRQLLMESVLLALAAALIALPFAWYGIGWVRDAVPVTDPMVPSYMQWSMDARTFGYAIGVALLTGLLFGLAPAFDATGRHLQNPLREGVGAAGSRVQRRTHRILIVAQMALALGLLATASLFVRTYAGLYRVPLGYDTAHLMTMRMYFSGPRYDQAPERERAIDDIALRLRTLPGAHAATVSDLVPLDDQGGSDASAEVDGRTFDEGKEPTVHYAGVAGRWPETFDMRIAPGGRTFRDEELLGKAPVAVVNAMLASTFWPGQNPLGRRFRIAEDETWPWMTVIGVVPDIRTVKLDESRATPPTAYMPHRFVSTRNYGIVVRTQANPESVIGDVRAAVRAVDPSLALFDVYSMEEVRWLSYWMYALWGTLFGVFGVIALVIAGVGVYGVMYYTVARRTREIGLRVALGASRPQVVGPMLRQSALLSALGLAIGLGAAYFITPIVGSLLIGVSPIDPVGLAHVSVTLVVIALVATWIPAWRASDVDPMIALRDE